MKSIIITGAAALLTVAGLSSCSNDLEYADTTATPVTKIYEPINDKSVKLASSSSAALLFEWEPCHAGNGAVPQYEVVFTTDGNLDNPIYRVTSDNVGSRPMATISHKTLSKIMAAAGVGSGETGTLKWGVISYSGINATKSSVVNNLTITRFDGFAEIPTSLYLGGEGTETGGDDLSAAIPFNGLDAETYEAFTYLKAGKPIYFSADKDGMETYSLRGAKVVEGQDGGTGVDTDGVYRVTLDFATASAKLQKVEHLYFRICDNWGDGPDFEYDYVGNGVYRKDDFTFHTFDTGWSWDPFESRYHMVMEYGDGTQVMWGPVNSGEDGKPGSLDIASNYFRMTEYGLDQWNYKWKLADAWYDVPCVYSVYFNLDNGAYTHFMEVK